MNKVEEFFNSNRGVYYSIKSLSKKFGLKRRKIYNICSNSPMIKKLVNYDIIGSGKNKLNIFYS